MIPVYKPSIGKEEEENVLKAVRSSWISSSGEFIERFENGLASYIGTKHGVATPSGTTALHLAFEALGIGAGDEVITPDLTFIASTNSIIYSRATPILSDIDRESWGLDVEKVRQKVTKKTKAVLAVHLYGNPCRIKELRELCDEKGIYLVEDCAEALGAEYGGRKVGTFGEISCFSFYGNKTITTGEGGMALTDSDELSGRMLQLRNHGQGKKRYYYDFIGFNYRMTNIAAAIGVAQLSKLENILQKKKKIVEHYQKELNGVIELQRSPAFGKSTFWLFSVLAKDAAERNSLIEHLHNKGIDTREFFAPAHLMPKLYAGSISKSDNYAVSTEISERGINLPSYPELTDGEVKQVTDSIKEFYGK